jgi:hypothetical protein
MLMGVDVLGLPLRLRVTYWRGLRRTGWLALIDSLTKMPTSDRTSVWA